MTRVSRLHYELGSRRVGKKIGAVKEGMMRAKEFARRLRERIAVVQGREPDKISVAEAARELGIPETTLRSTLEGRFPRTNGYMDKIRTYCQASLDWLFLGLGEPPEDKPGQPVKEAILVVESDLDKLRLIKMTLQGYRVEQVKSAKEAVLLMRQRHYDLILGGQDLASTAETAALLSKLKKRPRLIVLASSSPESNHPCHHLADEILVGPPQAGEIGKAVDRQLKASQPVGLAPPLK